MPCQVSCMISAIFIIGMIYFYNMTDKSAVVQHYKSSLSSDLQARYEKISKERMMISYQGYALGFLISLIVIYIHTRSAKKMNNISMVCTVLATAFVVNYFYYILHPKSDWMLNHLQNKEEIKAWLQMYREMQFNYHSGIVLGLIGVAIFAYAFRC